MVNVIQVSSKLKEYISKQIDVIANSHPLIGFMKPIITRAIEKYYPKINKSLYLIADESGNIDAENLLSEMITNLISTTPFTIDTSFAGKVEIGGGAVKINIPMTDKKLVFKTSDIEAFKEMLTKTE